MSEIITTQNIQKKIFFLRDIQVMLDMDIAELYDVETKVLNQAVKRNSDRFPEEFMFQLNESEAENLRSQFATSSEGSLRSQSVTLKKGRGQHRKYLPYVFSEQGVAMLSAVLHSETAVKVSIEIMNAFVAMRRFLRDNAQVFKRLDNLESWKVEIDGKVNNVLTAIEDKTLKPKQGIFYDGQVFDAWKFVSGLVRSANSSIILIDNYVDDTVLALFSKKKKTTAVTILTKNVTKQLETDVKKFNVQYGNLTLKEFNASHDRFLIVDDTELYHFGASLKDLGKKWFAFSKMEMGAVEMLKKVQV